MADLPTSKSLVCVEMRTWKGGRCMPRSRRCCFHSSRRVPLLAKSRPIQSHWASGQRSTPLSTGFLSIRSGRGASCLAVAAARPAAAGSLRALLDPDLMMTRVEYLKAKEDPVIRPPTLAVRSSTVIAVANVQPYRCFRLALARAAAPASDRPDWTFHG
jgi:hypothetical protein